jgi:hypothetical protein
MQSGLLLGSDALDVAPRRLVYDVVHPVVESRREELQQVPLGCLGSTSHFS